MIKSCHKYVNLNKCECIILEIRHDPWTNLIDHQLNLFLKPFPQKLGFGV